MHIGVDAQRLAGQPLGVGRYLEYMVKHWRTMLARPERMTLYTRGGVETDRLTLGPDLALRDLRPHLTGVTWQSFVLSRQSKDLDVLYCPSYAAPLWYPGRSVVAIHSMNEVQRGAHPWWYDMTYSRIYRRSARRAELVIVPAEATKQDLIRHYGIAEERIAIAPQGAPDSFGPINSEAELRETRRRFVGGDRPYVLFVGKLSQRRNIPTLMAAFAKLKRERKIPHSLLLVGPNRLNLPIDKLSDELGIADSFVQTDGRFADHTELIPIYNAADVFVHASSYEGFSMTIVEALTCGAPVITVNRPALREVVDGCALLVEEPTVDELAAAMWQVLSDDRLRQELKAKSLQRGKLFRWDTCAKITLDVLRKVASR